MTNFVMAVAPGYILYRRKSREGSPTVLYIFILCGTAFNFAPKGIGVWTTVMPQVFDQPIWYLVGAVALILAIYSLCTICKLPPKPQAEGKKKPTW